MLPGPSAHLWPEWSNVHDGFRMSLVDQPILPEDFFQQPFVRRCDYTEAWLIKLREEIASERDNLRTSMKNGVWSPLLVALSEGT